MLLGPSSGLVKPVPAGPIAPLVLSSNALAAHHSQSHLALTLIHLAAAAPPSPPEVSPSSGSSCLGHCVSVVCVEFLCVVPSVAFLCVFFSVAFLLRPPEDLVRMPSSSPRE
ncbi:hypothetical protein PIB30_016949 [Stylosanthes scabra]|uniref:Uncharacterized protein n=1 Tax=Stylosanthes scabra TaxID=79078 RepID=A0ABU6Y853_9FABA|nr:hypothetical protein [Stylosanthes scabra]